MNTLKHKKESKETPLYVIKLTNLETYQSLMNRLCDTCLDEEWTCDCEGSCYGRVCDDCGISCTLCDQTFCKVCFKSHPAECNADADEK